MSASRMPKRDGEVDERRDDRRHRNEQPREIHLRDDVLVAAERRAAAAQRRREVGPRHERRQREDRVGQAVGRHLRQLAEEDREDDHRHQRLDDRPGGAEHRLLVADLDVAPDEEIQQLAVRPDFRERGGPPTPGEGGHRGPAPTPALPTAPFTSREPSPPPPRRRGGGPGVRGERRAPGEGHEDLDEYKGPPGARRGRRTPGARRRAGKNHEKTPNTTHQPQPPPPPPPPPSTPPLRWRFRRDWVGPEGKGKGEGHDGGSPVDGAWQRLDHSGITALAAERQLAVRGPQRGVHDLGVGCAVRLEVGVHHGGQAGSASYAVMRARGYRRLKYRLASPTLAPQSRMRGASVED